MPLSVSKLIQFFLAILWIVWALWHKNSPIKKQAERLLNKTHHICSSHWKAGNYCCSPKSSCVYVYSDILFNDWNYSINIHCITGYSHFTMLQKGLSRDVSSTSQAFSRSSRNPDLDDIKKYQLVFKFWCWKGFMFTFCIFPFWELGCCSLGVTFSWCLVSRWKIILLEL